MKFVAAAALVGAAALHFWVYRFAGRTGYLPGRGGIVERRSKPRFFAFGRAVAALAGIGLLISAAAILISN
jgi:hypothetical protein